MVKNVYKIFIVLIIFLMTVAFASGEILIINDTVKDFYSLELVHVSGDLDKDSLNIIGSGEIISGKNVKVYLLGPGKDIVVKDVSLLGKDVPVSFDDKGYFIVVPEVGKFSFTGKLVLKKVGQIQLYVRGPINELTFDLEHGYPVNGNKYGVYDELVTIQRSEKTSTLVEGNFKYTYADLNTFHYLINLKSFGGTLGGYNLILKNAETVQSVTGVLDWKQEGNTLVLELESDNAYVNVNGIFDSRNLKIPLSEGVNKVIIESDAEKKISITTGAKELDLGEAGIGTMFPNARVFMAKPYDVFNIFVKQLDLMPSLAATVNSAKNTIAITKEGSVVGNLEYRYSNTGVDYIEIDAPGTPLYASTQSGAVKLTKDDKFLLAFPKSSNGRLEMVYFDTVDKLGAFEVINVPLAKTDLPVTTQTTQIYLPKEYYLLGTIGATGGSELPDIKSIIIFSLLVGGLAFLFIRKVNFSLLFTVFAAGLMYFSKVLFFMLLAVVVILIIKKYISKKVKWGYFLVAGGILLVIGFIVMIGIFGVQTISKSGSVNMMDYEMNDAVMEELVRAPNMKSLTVVGDDKGGAISVPTRTGVLPVKLQLPSLGNQVTVTNYLVTKENPVELKIVLISRWMFIVSYIIALVAGLLCFRIYKKQKLEDKSYETLDGNNVEDDVKADFKEKPSKSKK